MVCTILCEEITSINIECNSCSFQNEVLHDTPSRESEADVLLRSEAAGKRESSLIKYRLRLNKVSHNYIP